MSQITELSQNSEARRWNGLLVAQLSTFAAVGCYALWTQRYLYGDGSNFLLMILHSHKVLTYFPSRYFAHLVTQFPVVFLIQNLGCRDLPFISAVFGATLYLVPIGGLLLTRWAARWAPEIYLVYPLVSSSIIFLDTSGFVVSESQVASAIFWPTLYLLLFSPRLTIIRTTVLIALSLVATRAYESYFFLAWPLMFVAAHRGSTALRKRDYLESVTCGVAGLLFLTAIIVAATSIFDPDVPADADRFSHHGILHLIYPPVWFSLLTLFGVTWCAMWPNFRRGRGILRLLVWACGILVVLLPCVGIVGPWFQNCARVQAVYVPFLLGSMVIWKTMSEQPNPDNLPTTHVELWRLAAGACMVAVLFQFGSIVRWNEYRSDLLARLSGHRGVIGYEEGAGNPVSLEISNRERLLNRDLSQFDWGWTMPSLSLTLSALNLDSVSTIICVPKGTKAQAFDPRERDHIPDLREFGVRSELTANRQLKR